MLILAIPMMLLATLVSAVVLYFGIGYPNYYSWLTALLTGVLLSSTDPSIIIDIFRRAGVSERILLLLEGESLFNDSLAVLLFGLLSAMLLMAGESQTFTEFSIDFLVVFIGGLSSGAVVLLLIYPLFKALDGSFNRLFLMLLACYLSYLCAEVIFDLSGVMAVMVVGLGFSQWVREQLKVEECNKLLQYWSFQKQLSHSVMFLLLGVTITMTMFTQQWLAMLLGIGAVVVARVAGLLLSLPMINLLPERGLRPRESLIMYLGGTRGAVTIALALSIPVELDAWFTIQSIAYAVVLFGLLVQAVSAPHLIKHLISGDK
jgi:CPA1 family monovalent cation:H+ antiporter